MEPNLLQNIRKSRKISLKWMIILPFILEILILVALIGNFSYKSSQLTVKELTFQLIENIISRLEQQLVHYLEKPHQLNKSNGIFFKKGAFSIQDLPSLHQKPSEMEEVFWEEVQGDVVDTVTFANERNEVVIVRKHKNGNGYVRIQNQFTKGKRITYSLDQKGKRKKVIQITDYNVQKRPWYQKGKSIPKPSWSPIYEWSATQELGMTALFPMHNKDGHFFGLFGSDLRLTQIAHFLQKLKIGTSGKAIILEKSGKIVATSMGTPPFIKTKSDQKRLDFQDLTGSIQPVFQRLIKKYGNFKNITQKKEFSIIIQKERYMVQIQPFLDARGLDWLILVVIPEKDFMGYIYSNYQTTLWICFLSVLLVLLIGYWMAKKMSHPIQVLNMASKRLAKGEWMVHLPSSGIREVEELSESFSTMTAQIRKREEDLNKLNQAYYRFVPQKFLKLLQKESILDIEFGDCVQENMTILFSDIRSFTTISEGMTPKENFAFLNSYLSKMVPVIQKNNGIIDKFIGDAIMALFNGPADEALKAGVEMLRELRELNMNRKVKNQPPIQIGIGLHRGSLMVGTIGAENRMEATVISDSVNLASRLEGMTKMYGISLLISQEVVKHLNNPENFRLRLIDQVQAKGKKKSVIIYEVFNNDLPQIMEKKQSTLVLFHKGVSDYQKKEFSLALKCFQECLHKFPEDRPAQIYVQRCEYYLRVGWDEDWDGVTFLESK